MVHEPDPKMWEIYVWRTLAIELFAKVAATENLRAFGVDTDPSYQRPHVILTTSARTATLEFADNAQPSRGSEGGKANVEPHVHPGGIDSDLASEAEHAARFTIGGRG